MSRLPARLAPLAPALLLLLFAGWCGSFQGGASWPDGPCGQALVLAGALFGAAAAADPLRLGRSGRWLLWAALVAVLASAASSPVPRAGRTAVALLPALLLLPAALARAFRDDRRRDLALSAWSLAVAAIAVWALLARPHESGARAAMPLGHHNLLASFLVITLPVAAAGLSRRRAPRWLAAAALAAGLIALAATRSWLGWLAGLAILASIARAEPRARRAVAGAALLGLGLLLPRLGSMVAGTDLSTEARAAYARGGWSGISERPWLGWGPGATPWTLAEHLRPLPGVHPAGEAVGTLHSTALELAYEIGVPAALLAAAILGLFVFRILRGSRAAGGGCEPRLADCALLGVGAGFVMALGNSLLAVPAIPVALAAAAGVSLAACGGAPPAADWRRRVGVAAYLAVAAGTLAGPALAERAYEAAARGPRKLAGAALARAVALDPAFPLYRARQAWISSGPADERAASASAAAASARSVAALWLRAGGLALEAKEPDRARLAFARAMALDPLGGVAPFALFLASGGNAIDCAARAIAAEPRLLATFHWRQEPEQRTAAVARLATWPGLPAGFAAEVERTAAEIPAAEGERVDLGLQMDVTPALSVSLHQFRRSPWPADLARIPLDREAFRVVHRIGSAAARPDTDPAAFPRDRCAPAGDGG